MVKLLGREVTVVHTVSPQDEDKVQVTHADGTTVVTKQSQLELTEEEANAWFKAEQKKLQERWDAWKANLKAKVAAAKKAVEDQKKADEAAKKPPVVVEQKPTQALV